MKVFRNGGLAEKKRRWRTQERSCVRSLQSRICSIRYSLFSFVFSPFHFWKLGFLTVEFHQVNQEIEVNIQITREIESDIVKCTDIEGGLNARESELTKMVYVSQFEIDGLNSVAGNYVLWMLLYMCLYIYMYLFIFYCCRIQYWND